MQKKPPLTFIEAIDEYFGGVQGLAAMALPFTCKCGDNTYPKKEIQMPIMRERDCYTHIRKRHKEVIKKAHLDKSGKK